MCIKRSLTGEYILFILNRRKGFVFVELVAVCIRYTFIKHPIFPEGIIGPRRASN